ncbi:MAG: class I SAM-dependent methyltransferase [Actinomycetota bacterium]|nr:class I SAM-dependent methyltransferase [Actinomycetota bacterium]
MSEIRSFDQLLAAVEGVDGWMSPDQAERLYRAAQGAREGDTIVEIGSFRGRSTVILAGAARAGVNVIAIDPHAGNDRGPQEFEGYVQEASEDNQVFNANLAAAGVADKVRHVRAFSDAAHSDVQGEISVLYIDGAHRYRPARTDIRDWGARVQSGGTMLIHDSFSSLGVTGAILRELAFGTRFRYVGRARSMTEYRADLDGSLGSRAANTGKQLLQLPWFVKNLLVKVMISAKLGGLMKKVTGRDPEWPY